MKKKYILLSFIMIFIISLGSSDSSAETLVSITDNNTQKSPSSLGTPADTLKQESSGESKKEFHLEFGGNYNWLTENYGQWKALDLRLKYSGFDTIKPFGSISSQSRKEGTQMVYGLGSYIIFNPEFYMIVEVSGAPVRDQDVIIHPRLRMDWSAYFKAPIVKSIVLTTGMTHFPEQNGAGGDSISAGFIYYGKIIFNGSLNYNISRPGHDTSFSGQAGIMYGEEGKYWVGGGTTIGKVAYQTVSGIPIDVRYETRGFNLFYTRWLGKNWGIKSRFDYNKLVDQYILNGITIDFFIDF